MRRLGDVCSVGFEIGKPAVAQGRGLFVALGGLGL